MVTIKQIGFICLLKGLQEPASAIASALNLGAHIYMLSRSTTVQIRFLFSSNKYNFALKLKCYDRCLIMHLSSGCG